MTSEMLTLKDDFSLAHFAPATDGFQPPTGEFDPAEPGSHFRIVGNHPAGLQGRRALTGADTDG